MHRTGKSRRFLARLGAPVGPSEAQRVERVLATARAFLAISSLVAIGIDPTQPGRYATVAYGLLVIYVVHSLLIVVLSGIRHESTPGFRLGVHAVDILWPAVIALFTEGPNSPFYLYNVFALLTAAYRWGFQETIATACTSILLFFGQAVLVGSGPRAVRVFLEGEFDLNRLIIRGLYLLIMGYLLGYLGEEEKRLRAESSGIARVIAKAQAGGGLRGTLQAVLDEVAQVFGCTQVLLALREGATGRCFLWELRRPTEAQAVDLGFLEVASPVRERYFSAVPGYTWHAWWMGRPGSVRRLELLALSSEGERLRNVTWPCPEEFLAAHPFRSLLGTLFSFGDEWSGRLYLINPQPVTDREGELRFLQALVREVGPAVYSVYLVRRLRSRATAVERARVARELHDGVIQSLIAVEMQVDVLRRQATEGHTRLADELQGIQQILRQEVLNLRELMQQMRPVDLKPRQLLDYLADWVDKFRRETGITANFISGLAEVDLPPRTCNELARIVQEALINVRKHSGARHVVVRLASQDGHWKLVIDDDGRGFDFSGRLSLAELDAAHKGPLVIKERVRSIGAELAVESAPGFGARLEITLPQKSHA